MLGRIKGDLEEGMKKIKWFASLLSERTRIEITVFKLLYQSEELRKQRDELLRRIGEEVVALKGKHTDIYTHQEILATLKELELLEPQIRETMEKASDISKMSA